MARGPSRVSVVLLFMILQEIFQGAQGMKPQLSSPSRLKHGSLGVHPSHKAVFLALNILTKSLNADVCVGRDRLGLREE